MHTKQDIIDLLMRNDRAVGRALVVLNNRQTADERTSERTKHQNNRGFNAAHAKRGTSMASFYQRTGFLTQRQVRWWRCIINGTPRIALYAGQLLDEAQAKASNGSCRATVELKQPRQ